MADIAGGDIRPDRHRGGVGGRRRPLRRRGACSRRARGLECPARERAGRRIHVRPKSGRLSWAGWTAGRLPSRPSSNLSGPCWARRGTALGALSPTARKRSCARLEPLGVRFTGTRSRHRGRRLPPRRPGGPSLFVGAGRPCADARHRGRSPSSGTCLRAARVRPRRRGRLRTVAGCRRPRPGRDAGGCAGGHAGRLGPGIRRALEETGATRLYEDVERPLVRVLAKMELAGIAVDIDRLQAISES